VAGHWIVIGTLKEFFFKTNRACHEINGKNIHLNRGVHYHNCDDSRDEYRRDLEWALVEDLHSHLLLEHSDYERWDLTNIS
jgi:hypothetical protein